MQCKVVDLCLPPPNPSHPGPASLEGQDEATGQVLVEKSDQLLQLALQDKNVS